MCECRLLRWVVAIFFYCRAGFSANGMGVWKVPEDRIFEVGGRMVAFCGILHCYQRLIYEDWFYFVFMMVYGCFKEECDAIFDVIVDDIGVYERATLYSSTKF